MKVCCRCRTAKPHSEYWNQRAAPDGLQRLCKDCLRSRKVARRAAMDPIARPESGTKQCSRCRALLPVGRFTSAPRERDGLHSRCKSCQNAVALLARRLDPERSRNHVRRWRAANTARANAATRAWEIRNPDKARAKWARHSAKRASVDIRTLTPSEWRDTIDYYGSYCAYCLAVIANPEMDHLIPLSKNGEHAVENVAPACRSCNARKSNRPIWTMV